MKKLDLTKLTLDATEVKDISVLAVNHVGLSARCHEMAYIICRGMQTKGYECYVEDGILKDRNRKHSHVVVPNPFLGLFGRNRGVILDFMWEHSFVRAIFGRPPLQIWKVLTAYSQKKEFYRTKLDYTLNSGTRELAEMVFPFE